MANIALTYKTVADDATLSGTGWSTSLPLTNMLDKRLQKVARAESLGTGTQIVEFTIDLGAFTASDYSTYRAYDSIALVNHSLSPKAKISIKTASDSGFSNLGENLVFEEVYKVKQSEVNWNWANPKFYSKQVSEIDLYGFIRVYVHAMDTAQSNSDRGVVSANGRYIKITITDEYNESQRTYIDIGRIFIGKRYSTEYNMVYGASIRYEDVSIVQSSIGGELYSDKRAKKRIMTFNHDFLSKSEALSGALDIQRISGITDEILVIADTDDTAYGFKRDFVGRLKQTTDIQQWTHNLYKTGFEIEEIL